MLPDTFLIEHINESLEGVTGGLSLLKANY